MAKSGPLSPSAAKVKLVMGQIQKFIEAVSIKLIYVRYKT